MVSFAQFAELLGYSMPNLQHGKPLLALTTGISYHTSNWLSHLT